MISIDTECTGVDFRHGTLPYFVTTCDENDEHENFEWVVDPYTRKPNIDKHDVERIKHIVEVSKNWGEPRYDKETASRHTLILQNAKFDITALGFVDSWFRDNWPWKQTRDTVIAGHLLDTGNPHNLTDMVSQYLNLNIQPLEDAIEAATQKARRYVRRHLPDWQIAKEGRADMPSAKSSGKDEGKTWKADMWLPKALVIELGYDKVSEITENEEHHWDTLLADYANGDTYSTLHLWEVMEKLLKERDLWEIFEMRMKLPPIAFKMEHRGITLSKTRMEKLREEYQAQSERAEAICVNIASDYKDDDGHEFKLTLPKSGNNKKLTDFIFNRLKLPPIKETATGNPSLDKEAMTEYLQTLPAKSLELLFVQQLAAKRKRDTALTYMESYERFWRQVDEEFYRLHPNLNITGTAHLRWSCSNPNEQNISKQEGFNLRWMFGPSEGREWWSLDAQNIELRIPAFEAGEKDLMEVFLKPKEPPYYGSYHLVIFDALHPELFKKHGKACKDLFESTWYQWVKNGNFAMIYGCQEKKADATYHVPGAFQMLRRRFPKIAQLADKQIAIANKTGGIETIPNKSVNPRRGYPIKCSFGNYGKVKPTLPLNYHVSGTAMEWMGMAMIGCDEQIQQWQEKAFDAYMIMQVHDEIVFDLPKGDYAVERVISGGQTGVDQAGLRAAKELLFTTGGYINQGYKTLKGRNESLREYGLVEIESTYYSDRTKRNVKESDGTIRIATDFKSPGERCTYNAIREYGKPSIDIDVKNPLPPEDVVKWFKKNNIKTLNVAGNSEETSKGIGKFAEGYLKKVLALTNSNIGKVNELRELMELGGDDINVPTPVAMELNPTTWDKGITV